jgi:ribose/xylose/arabinose/galactoside ABC-type transport system permease subunit
MTESYWSITGNPFPIYGAVPLMLLMGLGLGSSTGAAVSRVNVPPLIATLALWEISKGIGFQITHGSTILELPRGLAFFGQTEIAGVPVPTIIFISVAVVTYFVLYHTTFGRNVYAVGGNPASAWLSGINVKRVLLSVYAISGFLAGLAGVVIIGRTMGGSMLSAGGLELESIAAVVIGGVSLSGGRGTLVGAIMGVIIMGVISNGMNVLGIDPRLQNLVTGGIIYTAVSIDMIRRRR